MSLFLREKKGVTSHCLSYIRAALHYLPVKKLRIQNPQRKKSKSLKKKIVGFEGGFPPVFLWFDCWIFNILTVRIQHSSKSLQVMSGVLHDFSFHFGTQGWIHVGNQILTNFLRSRTNAYILPVQQQQLEVFGSFTLLES